MNNNIGSHTASFLGGSMLATAMLGILTGQFHVNSELASDWLIVTAAILGGPVLAYLSVKAQSDPALAAALAALNALQPNGQQQGVTTVSAAPHTTVVTTEPAPTPPPPPPPAAVAAATEGAPAHA